MASTHLALKDLSIYYAGSNVPVVAGLSLEVQPGELVTLLGPSGSGKSSTLLCIAGFVQPQAGAIEVDGHSILELPPERREIALVTQEPALFPHLNLRDNVAFGLRMRGMRREECGRRAREMLAAVQLDGYGARRPHQLSGGQRQRAALARALIIEPRLLLLDEPFAALDPELRDEMRALTLRLQRERRVSSILVTHDQQEAAMLSDRIALLIDGRVQQVAPPEDLYRRPATLAVARFFGAENFITGSLDPGGHRALTTLGALPLQGSDAPPGPATLIIRPEHIRVSGADCPGIAGLVRERSFLGTAYRYTIAAGPLLLTAITIDGSFQPGEQVRLTLPPEHLCVLPQERC